MEEKDQIIPEMSEDVSLPEEKPKVKRTRKKKTEEQIKEEIPTPESDAEDVSGELDEPSPNKTEDIDIETGELSRETKTNTAGTSRRAGRSEAVLTIEAGGSVATEEMQADTAWHDICNAYYTRRMLSGVFGGIESMDNGKIVGIVEYKGYRILIPFKEMSPDVQTQTGGSEYTQMVLRMNRRFSSMLGAEIDFVVRGIDTNTRSVVASRKEAMLKKRQVFYLDLDANKEHRVKEGRIVQARVISVSEKQLRVEIFGVETAIFARDISWEWVGDVRDSYSVGQNVLVRITSVQGEDVKDIAVKAVIKGSRNTVKERLALCRPQSKYAGKVIDVHNGTVFIRLTNGVNAVAHSCYDRRTPGKKDDVSFVVTRIDDERNVATGIITRIIKQNL